MSVPGGALWLAAAALLLWAPACNVSLDVESKRFACEADEDCLDGYFCRPIAGQPGFKACTSDPNAGGGDADGGGEPDVETDEGEPDDGGPTAEVDADAEQPDCVTDDDCVGKVEHDAQCQKAVCTAGQCAVEDVSGGCDDGDPCTSDDTCAQGACGGEAYTCTPAKPQCQVGQCLGDGGCAFTIKDGACLIQGQCLDEGDEGPGGCLACVPGASKTEWSPVADDTPCDADSDPCTQDDACKSGICQPGPLFECSDEYECTDDVCVAGEGGELGCESTVKADRCLIEQTCYDAGDGHPDVQCFVCDPGQDSGAWTAQSAVPCDNDGSGCTVGDSCDNGVCKAGPPADCDDGISCTQDLCQPSGTTGFVCDNPTESGWCNVGGVCAEQGETNPQNPCEFCNTSASNSEWSLLPNDSVCDADGDGCTVGDVCVGGVCVIGATNECDDGDDCTEDTCVSTGAQTFVCDNQPIANVCSINGACYPAGETNPDEPCEICDIGQSTTSWSTAANGTPCDADGSGCTVGDACVDGTCTAGPPPDCDDQLDCTDDGCEPLTATEYACTPTANGNGCFIEGACYADGEAPEGAPCEECNPANNPVGWSAKLNGAACNADDDGCTVGDICMGGNCVKGTEPDCNDDQACTIDGCASIAPDQYECTHTPVSSQCYIDSQCFGPGTPNAVNPCEFCDPDTAVDAWTAVAPGTSCGSDSVCAGTSCVEAPLTDIPAGPFWMGCNVVVDNDCETNETPFHEVTTPAYAIETHEVSVAQYRECYENGPCTEPFPIPECTWPLPDNDELPINCINFSQAQTYCAWLGRRLCSEAEWEKAARGGCDIYGIGCGAEESIYPWGNGVADCSLAQFNICGNLFVPVSDKAGGASPYGVLNLAGNVSEWVEDCRHADYTGAPTDGSAWVDDCSTTERARRGGDSGSPATEIRSSARSFANPLSAGPILGLRCCADP